MNRCALFNTLHLTPTIHNLLNKGTLICRVGSMCKYLFPSCHYMFAPLCEWGENVWLYGDVRHKGVGWGWGGGSLGLNPNSKQGFHGLEIRQPSSIFHTQVPSTTLAVTRTPPVIPDHTALNWLAPSYQNSLCFFPLLL